MFDFGKPYLRVRLSVRWTEEKGYLVDCEVVWYMAGDQFGWSIGWFADYYNMDASEAGKAFAEKFAREFPRMLKHHPRPCLMIVR